MRTIDAIAASAGLLGCAVVFATSHHGLTVRDSELLAEEARLFEAELGRAMLWIAGSFERCYAMADALGPAAGSPADQGRMRMHIAQACSPDGLSAFP